MRHQSKERNMSKSQKKRKKKHLTRSGLTRFHCTRKEAPSSQDAPSLTLSSVEMMKEQWNSFPQSVPNCWYSQEHEQYFFTLDLVLWLPRCTEEVSVCKTMCV